MANPDQLRILKKGIKAWSKRRKQKPTVVDLKGLDVHGVNLGEAKMNRANLHERDLFGQILVGQI